MSLNQPLISYVIATRNDNHCGDSHGRLVNTVAHLKLNFEAEIIVVDWGSEVPYGNPQGVHRARQIIVPPSITSSYGPHLCETVALNVGIRRAKGLYVARLDQDILCGLKYRSWTRMLPDSEAAVVPAYFSERRELAEHVLQSSHDIPGACIAPRWSEWPIDHPHFYRAAVGILLARRSDWHNLRGYDESLKYRNHMEHDLCMRFARTCGLVNLGPIVDYDFYHQYHERPVGIPSNAEPSLDYIRNCPIEANDVNWGLGSIKLEERYL